MVANLSDAWVFAHSHIQRELTQQHEEKCDEGNWKIDDTVMVILAHFSKFYRP